MILPDQILQTPMDLYVPSRPESTSMRAFSATTLTSPNDMSSQNLKKTGANYHELKSLCTESQTPQAESRRHPVVTSEQSSDNWVGDRRSFVNKTEIKIPEVFSIRC